MSDNQLDTSKFKDALLAIVRQYRPTWHYAMGKTGYECSFCGSMSNRIGDFWMQSAHNDDCALMQAYNLSDETE